MKSIVSIILCLTALSGLAKSTIYVLDAEDNTPVGSATIFSSSGTIIGLTSNNGAFQVDDNDRNLPLMIRCLGYEPAEVMNIADNQTIMLNRKSFELNEVVVSSSERPITRLVCYLREYITAVAAGNTMIMFNEHMADFMIAEKKVKGFKPFDKPRFLNTRAYSRTAYADGRDTIYRPKYRDDTFAWDQFVRIPSGFVSFPEAVSAGLKSDTVKGKYGVKEIIRENGNFFYLSKDYLVDKKEHTMSPMFFKMLGLTVDINELQESWIINPQSRKGYYSTDIISGTLSMKIFGKGKWIKKMFKTEDPVEMYVLYEIYPIEVEYLTVYEAKELKDNSPTTKFERGPNITPLSPSIQRIIDYIDQRDR